MYTKISFAPKVMRWDVPGRFQGQHIEVAFSATSKYEADNGAPYKRVTDRSIAPGRPSRVTYYALVGGAS